MPDGIESRATEYAMGKAKSINVVGRIKEAFMDGYREGYAKGKKKCAKQKHGHWKLNAWMCCAQCSECGHLQLTSSTYCESCGAKLDEDIVNES